MSDVHKHLVGRHDQQDHDPTKPSKKRPGAHSRKQHMPWTLEGVIAPGKNAKRIAQAQREAYHEKNPRGMLKTSQVLNAARDGEIVAIRRERVDRRKLSRDENNLVVHAFKEHTGKSALAVGAGALLLRNPNMAREWIRWTKSLASGGKSASIARPFRDAMSSGKVSPELRQVVNRTFEGRFGNLTSRVSHVSVHRRSVSVTGSFYKEGKWAGDWGRTFGRNGSVHHDIFQLNRSHQGNGAASAWYKHTSEQYRKAGFDRIEMLANLDVGGYAWARQGFGFSTGTATASRLYIGSRATRTARAHSSYTTRDVARARLMMLKPGTTPQDFMKIGQSRRWTDASGHEHWFGKDLLLGSAWPAIKRL
jgi:GNAT superfamily N-acetyltransferase